MYPSGLIQTYGYREPSGVYFSEYEPGRFLGGYYRPNFTIPINLYKKFEFNLSNTSQLGGSAYRQIYYNLNDYANKILQSGVDPPYATGTSFTQNIVGDCFETTGLFNWLREKEQISWLYYDQGFSGNYTHKLYKSSAYPFDDIGSGGENVNSTGIFGFTYNEGWGSFTQQESARYRFLSQETSLLMPFYQIVKILKTIVSGISYQCDNPVYNSGYPGLLLGGGYPGLAGGASEYRPLKMHGGISIMSVSGIPTPALSPYILTQLNNMSLRPTGFYPNWGTGVVLPGSGFLPWLDLAQQANMPREYMTNHNIIYRMPILENSISGIEDAGHRVNLGVSTRKIYTNFPTSDFLSTRIDFAFLQSGIYSVEFSGCGGSVIVSGISVDRFGNKAYTSQFSVKPVFYNNLSTRYQSPTSTQQGLNTVYWNNSDNMLDDYYFYTTGYIYNFTGYSVQFNRFYDPSQPNLAGTGDDEDNQYPFINANEANGRHYSFAASSAWYLEFVSGLAGHDDLFINIPSNVLVLNSGDFLLKINGLEIPTTEYRNTETTRLDTWRNYRDSKFGGPCSGAAPTIHGGFLGSGVVSPIFIRPFTSTYWKVTAWSGIIDVTHDVFKALTPHYIADTGIHYFTATIVSGTFPIPQNYGFATGNTLDLSTFTALPTGWSRINTRHRFNVSSTSLNFHDLQQMYPVIKHSIGGFTSDDVMGRICQINSINAYANVLATGYWLESGISTTTFTNFPVSITTGTYGVPGFFTGYGGPYSGLISPSKCGNAASSWWN